MQIAHLSLFRRIETSYYVVIYIGLKRCCYFDYLGINIEEVLLAARTKWNFLPFRLGIVGGYSIGVEPYYLTHEAIEVGVDSDHFGRPAVE